MRASAMLSTLRSTWTCEIYTCVESVSGLMFPWPWTQHPLHPSAFKRLPMMLCSLFRDPPPPPFPQSGSDRILGADDRPDQVSCLVPGVRCVMITSTAWTFRFLGGTRQSLYVTSSPSTGTYSPSILRERERDGRGTYTNTWRQENPKTRWDGATASDSMKQQLFHTNTRFCIDYMH